MGFTDNYSKKVSSHSSTTGASVQKNAGANAVADTTQTFPIIFCDDGDDNDPNERRVSLIPDQEILDSIEEVYFQMDADIGIYELNVSGVKMGCTMTHSREIYGETRGQGKLRRLILLCVCVCFLVNRNSSMAIWMMNRCCGKSSNWNSSEKSSRRRHYRIFWRSVRRATMKSFRYRKRTICCSNRCWNARRRVRT